MPFTVCLVVLGRHVEGLNFFEVLLGDKPALTPQQSFFQRVLTGDSAGATYHAELALKDEPRGARREGGGGNRIGFGQRHG